MSAGRQFGRAVKVLLGDVLLCEYDSEAGLRRGLDVRFKIDRAAVNQPQNSILEVWGLNQAARERISRKVFEAREQSYLRRRSLRTAQIRIIAGRPGAAQELSRDYVMNVTHDRDGADWKSTFTCQDGLLAWSESYVSESSDGTLDPIQAAQDFAKEYDLLNLATATTLPEAAPDAVAGGFTGIAGGVQMFGASHRVNSQLMSALNRRPVWQKGQWQWTRLDLAEITPAIELVEGATALSVSEPGQLGVRKVRAMLDPQIEISRQIFLRLNRVTPASPREVTSGPYRVDSVTYSGETRGPAWYADTTLRPTKIT